MGTKNGMSGMQASREHATRREGSGKPQAEPHGWPNTETLKSRVGDLHRKRVRWTQLKWRTLAQRNLGGAQSISLIAPANPKYSEELLAAMNQKLNALIDEEVGEDKALFTPPKKD